MATFAFLIAPEGVKEHAQMQRAKMPSSIWQFCRSPDATAVAKQLSSESITGADLLDYVQNSSDFGFELQVQRVLSNAGFAVEHAGTYSDPVTGKARQFDLRATNDVLQIERSSAKLIYTARLIVECKNLKPSNPLLLSCVPRTNEEARHFAVFSKLLPSGITISHFRDLPQSTCAYKARQPVGKATDQVGRATGAQSKPGVLVSDDRDVWEKWSQALASAEDVLLRTGEYPALAGERQQRVTEIYPIVVVPDGTLWKCVSQEAELVEAPHAVDACAFFVNKEMGARVAAMHGPFAFTHLEFFTVSGLATWLAAMTEGSGPHRAAELIDQLANM